MAQPRGNSVDAKRCQNYQDWYTRDGQAFTSAAECIAYAAKGAQIINGAALGCLNGGWMTLGPDATTTFTSEQECVDFAVGGGTLVVWSDVRLGFEDSAAVTCVTPLNPAYCISQDVRVYNDGSVPVTVSVTLSGTYDQTPTNSFAGHLINSVFCTGTDDGISSWSASCTVTNVPAGGSTFLARMWAYLGASHVGSATVTASSSPDPTSSNDTASWNFTAPTLG